MGSGRADSQVLDSREGHIINVAPTFLAALYAELDDWMTGLVKMLGGMLAGRGVATADVPADEAQAQVHPPTTRCQTDFAPFRVGGYILNLVNVLDGATAPTFEKTSRPLITSFNTSNWLGISSNMR